MSTFRIDGLVSGLDTSSMIDQLMAIERLPIQALQRQQSAIQARQAAWQELASRVQGLQAAASALLQRSSLNGNVVTFNTGSAPLTAKATADTVSGTYSLTISALATGTVARSIAPIGAEITSSDTLSAINFPVAVTAGTFSINGVSISVDPAADSLDDVIARINGADAGVTASLATVDGRQHLALTADSPGGAIQIGSAGDTSNFLSATSLLAAPRDGDSVTGMRNLGVVRTGVALKDAALATPISGSGTLTINNVEIAYNADTDSLSTIISRINASGAGVIASYDAATDRFQLKNKETGSITIAMSDTGSFLSAMGIDTPAAQTLGNNAAYSLDGGATMRYSASNTVTDAIPGVTLTFTGTTTTPVELTVAPDVDSAVAAVKKFVDQYNSVMSYIRDKSSYNAATKTGGPLNGDSGARSLAAALRQQIVAPAAGLAGGYQMLAQVGVSFGKFGSAVGTTDTLQVDEAKLRAALQDNPRAVLDLFAAQPSATLTAAGDIVSVSGKPTDLPSGGRYEIASDGAGTLTATFYDADGVVQFTRTGAIEAGGTNTSLIPGVTLRAASALTGAASTVAVSNQRGVIDVVNDYLETALGPDGVFKIRQDGADDDVRRLDKQIQQLEDRLADREDRLVRQFAAMESLLARLQAQSAALTSQLAGLMANTQRNS